MSDEFLGVIIENAQNEIRKAPPAALAGALARLGPAIANKLPSILASPKLDAAAIAATPIAGPMAPGALAALRGGQAARSRGQAKVAGGRAEAARRQMREAAEEASKESMATTDLRTRAGINVKANQPTETAFTPSLGDYGSPEKIGEQLSAHTSAAAEYKCHADDLTQA